MTGLFERLLDFPQLVWAVAIAFYLVDVGRCAERGQLLLIERWQGAFRPLLSRVPFEFRGGELYLPSPFAPWRAVLLGQWMGDSPVAGQEAYIRRQLERLLPLRLIAAVNFAALVVAGPILTWLAGLTFAFLIVCPIVYMLNLVAGAWVIARHAELGLGRTRAISLMVDALLCAPYGANWVRRVARSWPTISWATASSMVADADRTWVAAVIADRTEMAEEHR